MKLFATPEAIISETEAMEKAEFHRREDRATVSGFFNGEPPLTPEEAEDLGLTVNVNNLFGYSEVNGAKRQLLSLYTKPTQLFAVSIDAVPAPAVRDKWEMQGGDALNSIIKDTGRLKPAYEGVAGDAALHGEAALFFPNATDWCPSQAPLSKLLIPDDAPADARKLTHWAIESVLTIGDIHRYLRSGAKGWKASSLRLLLKQIYQDVEAASVNNLEGDYNPEELEYQRQRNSGTTGRRRPSVRVYYFYQVRADKPGGPVDLTIILHRGETLTNTSSSVEPDDRVLYEREGAFDSAEDCLCPFFMSCTIGGEPMWHRVMGLGTLNYQLSHAVELLINRAMQGTLEGMMNLWKAKDAASREDIQRILLRHNGVVPENVELIQQRFEPDLQGSLGMIQFFRQQGSKNAQGVTPNNGDPNRQLQVQAVYEQSQSADAQGAELSNWYDHLDRLAARMWARLVNPFIEPSDPGYSEILKFQSRLTRQGIPLFWMQPHNVSVRAVRIMGDGDQQRALQGANFLMANQQKYGPQKQMDILRHSTAVFTGSYELAENLVPMENKPDPDQVKEAQNEGNTCLLQFTPPEVEDDDIDEIHVPTHLNAMVSLIKQAATGGAFSDQQTSGFTALGAHVTLHIRKKEAMVSTGKGDQNKAMAAQWMQNLNDIAAAGEKLEHNRQQQGQQGAQPLDPHEVAKLQLMAQGLQLQQEKFQFSRDKWERQQMHKESQTAFQRAQDLGRSQREDFLARNKAAANDVSSALKAKQLREPAPAAAE